MATLREYFDADFGNTARVHVKIRGQGADFISVILYDFSAYIVFFASYVPGAQHSLQQFLQLIEAIQPGKTEVTFDDKMYLPQPAPFQACWKSGTPIRSSCVQSFLAIRMDFRQRDQSVNAPFYLLGNTPE
jgi:hypothetical protein